MTKVDQALVFGTFVGWLLGIASVFFVLNWMAS
jgi:hypothetical protein